MSKEIELWIKKIFILILFVIIAYAGYLTQNILFIILISGFLTLLITPLVEKWKKYHTPEWLTIVFVYIVAAILAIIVIATIIPIVINYFSGVIINAMSWVNDLQANFRTNGIDGLWLPDFLKNIIHILFSEENIGNTLEIIRQNLGNIQSFLSSQLSNIASGSLSLVNGGISIVSSIGSVFTNLLFIAITTFFMVLERKSIGELFINLTPDHMEDSIKRIFGKVQIVCISWIRATAILGLSIFAMTYIGLFIVELIFGFKTENNFTLALISGIMEFIPYIGPILSLVPAIIIGLGIWFHATIALLILYVIIQQSENNFLVPYIMSKNLDISPLFVFVIMLFGASIGGILGIILAVPIAGVVKAIYIDYLEQKTSYKIEKTEPQLPEIKIPVKKYFHKMKRFIKK